MPLGSFVRTKEMAEDCFEKSGRFEEGEDRGGEGKGGEGKGGEEKKRSEAMEEKYFGNDEKSKENKRRSGKKDWGWEEVRGSEDGEVSPFSERSGSGIIRNVSEYGSEERRKRRGPLKEREKSWNSVYYKEDSNKVRVYFEFVEECVASVISMVNKLPF